MTETDSINPTETIDTKAAALYARVERFIQHGIEKHLFKNDSNGVFASLSGSGFVSLLHGGKFDDQTIAEFEAVLVSQGEDKDTANEKYEKQKAFIAAHSQGLATLTVRTACFLNRLAYLGNHNIEVGMGLTLYGLQDELASLLNEGLDIGLPQAIIKAYGVEPTDEVKERM